MTIIMRVTTDFTLEYILKKKREHVTKTWGLQFAETEIPDKCFCALHVVSFKKHVVRKSTCASTFSLGTRALEFGTCTMLGVSQCLPSVCSAACQSSHGEPRLLSMCFILQSLHPSAAHALYFA